MVLNTPQGRIVQRERQKREKEKLAEMDEDDEEVEEEDDEDEAEKNFDQFLDREIDCGREIRRAITHS